jgi:hypothetical protein
MIITNEPRLAQFNNMDITQKVDPMFIRHDMTTSVNAFDIG